MLRFTIFGVSRINDEARVRPSAKLVVFGNAKVMSYEDIEEARVKRDGKRKAPRERQTVA